MIELGDVVTVNCNNAHMTISFEAVVKVIPNATGQGWEFEEPNGRYIYVSEGCTIIKKSG